MSLIPILKKPPTTPEGRPDLDAITITNLLIQNDKPLWGVPCLWVKVYGNIQEEALVLTASLLVTSDEVMDFLFGPPGEEDPQFLQKMAIWVQHRHLCLKHHGDPNDHPAQPG